ncbi:tRNA pseudouridine(38-40) synthase TruA [Spongiibacter taiwanensis]|uniref:tRNA pseudouridine(38-40) synthase TruA n=1 Tax=Spongiibacter taiwanensis TaxID=1748242 RepID=UPI002034CE7E|nr:tRNA pseudouridine(38-40) synthase TruA [Spongiibacter taiwanensis]USA43193.1 tRNA pseudouridine(38-40) synthase TruA [Spongiibacter taiwanensis]
MNEQQRGFTRLDSAPLNEGRIALAVEYQGGAYRGWQRQADPPMASVQAQLEAALSQIAATDITVVCAGRTDAGVHAAHQVVHFDAPAGRSQKAWVKGGNSLLPNDVVVKWAVPVSADFHARFSATRRRYRYVILNRSQPSAYLAGMVTHVDQPLDVSLMHREAQVLVGEQDFSAFRAASCQSHTPWRFIEFVEVRRWQDFVVIDIQGNAFLHHMVRNIAGVLMAVGLGEQAPGWTAKVLASQDRTQGGVTAKPDGLFLVDVAYPENFALPVHSPGPSFLNGEFLKP